MKVIGLKLDKFKTFIIASGAEIIPSTNEYEFVRFRCQEGVGIVYTTKRSHVTLSGAAITAYDFFIHNRKWVASLLHEDWQKPSTRTALLKRDGEGCLYCGKKMKAEQITVEHILSRVDGGNNNIANLALAHEKCNKLAGSLPIVEKVKLILEMRGK